MFCDTFRQVRCSDFPMTSNPRAEGYVLRLMVPSRYAPSTANLAARHHYGRTNLRYSDGRGRALAIDVPTSHALTLALGFGAGVALTLWLTRD
jgi:hypothetical protein